MCVRDVHVNMTVCTLCVRDYKYRHVHVSTNVTKAVLCACTHDISTCESAGQGAVVYTCVSGLREWCSMLCV